MPEEKSNNNSLIAVISVLAVVIIGLAIVFYIYHRSHSGGTRQASCLSASDAWKNIGKSGCVNFTVGYTFVSPEGNTYLDQNQNYSTGIQVWIPARYTFGRSLTTQYANKNINVTGTITRYRGAPEIEVTDPSQIQLAQ